MRPSILSIVLALSLPFSEAAQDSFTKVKGLRFEIDGVAKYWAGTNGYWIPFLMKNSDIDLALDRIAGAGMKIVRTWGFNDVNSVPSKGTSITFVYSLFDPHLHCSNRNSMVSITRPWIAAGYQHWSGWSSAPRLCC